MEENNEPNQSQNPKEPTSAPILDVQPSQESAPSKTMDVLSPTDTSSVSEDKPVEASPVAPNSALDPVKQPEITASHKHGAPIVPIILAIVVAAALAVITVLAFKNTKPAPVNTTQTPVQQESAVTPESLDATSAEIEQSLNNTDETADFPETELTDQTLGL